MEQKEKDRKNMKRIERKMKPGEGIPLQDFTLLGLLGKAEKAAPLSSDSVKFA